MKLTQDTCRVDLNPLQRCSRRTVPTDRVGSTMVVSSNILKRILHVRGKTIVFLISDCRIIRKLQRRGGKNSLDYESYRHGYGINEHRWETRKLKEVAYVGLPSVCTSQDNTDFNVVFSVQKEFWEDVTKKKFCDRLPVKGGNKTVPELNIEYPISKIMYVLHSIYYHFISY